MTVRVWLPATVAELGRWWADREVPARAGHAVTAALRASWPEGSEEEWEYAVLLAAAGDAAAMLASPGRRVVVVADADDGAVEEAEGSAVRLATPVPWRRLAAVHADPPGTLVGPADQDAPELCWYAVQEVPDVVAAPEA